MWRSVKLCCRILVVLITAATTTWAQDTAKAERPVQELRAFRVNGNAPVVDGRLDDAAWSVDRAMLARNFIQEDPDEGKAATESTLVAVAYDDNAIYLAFWCYDSQPDKIVRQLVRRDRSNESDAITACLDPAHDHQTGNYFRLSAAGVQGDGRYYNNDWSEDSWDAVWEGDVQMQPWGWSAEMRIPYYCLRFPEKEEHVWGIALDRSITHKNEYTTWFFTPSAEGGGVSKAGHLTGLTGIHPARRAEMLPYLVSKMETQPKSIGNPDGRDVLGSAGFDVKYALSSDLILDATVNPDFGQVELDQPVLNLSTYETFYEERRPFFVEGSNLFNTGYQLFYSRRIGRPPRGSITDPELSFYRQFPQSTTILGAAKITGKLADRTTIALLTSVTDREKAEYGVFSGWFPDTTFMADTFHVNMIPRDTLYRNGVVEAEANYSVLRVKQDIFRNSFVGGMVTMATQDEIHPATTGGVDWRLYTPKADWLFSGQTVFSRAENRKTGYGIDADIQRVAGKHIRGSVGVRINSPDLRLNRLGYLGRSNQRNVNGWLQYRTTDDWWIVRNSWNNINFHAGWNYQGINNSLGWNWNSSVELKNGWSVWTGTDVQAETFSDEETRGNGNWIWPQYPTYMSWIGFSTDYRKPVCYNMNLEYATDRGGNHYGPSAGVTIKPRSNLEFDVNTHYHRTFKATRWVQNVRDDSVGITQSVFGDLDQDIITFSISALLVLRRNLSIQASGEGLISGLNYSNYRYYLGENDYSAPVSGFNSDYNYSAMNSMLLLRWEYIPGSTLYLVWARARDQINDTINDLTLSRDFSRLFDSGGGNVFLIKTSYWMSI